ncbi:uncharacterized protein [Henckelia pumila]|uniref:uncharacterized protein n=1 Tax=Henckelia pumila TaxID=405737 RepID=UPI003C6E0102
MAKGLCWRVGDGSDISIYSDRWVPYFSAPLAAHPHHAHCNTVSTLITNGAWNSELVTQLFSHHISRNILGILLIGSSRKDCKFWSFDQKGKYSVQDGYKVEFGFYEPSSSCSADRSKKWWKFLWALSIPPKVCIFWWRAVNNLIPTTVNLKTHHVPVKACCPLCFQGRDDSTHALFSCPIVKSGWKSSKFWTILKKVRHLELIDIFLYLQESLSKLDVENVVMRSWAIRKARQDIIHNNVVPSLAMNVDWCEGFLRDFQYVAGAIVNFHNRNSTLPDVKWLAPPFSQLRLDVDAAYKESTNSFAIAGIVHNHEGQPVFAFGRRIEKPQNIIYAELAAIEAGIMLARQLHHHVTLITSDSLLAMQAVTIPDENFSYSGALAHYIRNLLFQDDAISLRHVRNGAAHSIASFASSNSVPFVWERGSFSYWLIALVIKDLCNS